MKELRLISEIPPSVNHYKAMRTVMKNGKPFVINYKTKEAVNYQTAFADYVAEEVMNQGWETDLEDRHHFYVDGVFYFERERSDPNNYWKCLLDAITDTKKIWVDDDIVCERTQGIYYDAENPRIELYIHPAEYIGIFNNDEQLEEFKANNCIDCKRYKRNCSILNKAIGGHIQKEINNLSCSKLSKAKEIKG